MGFWRTLARGIVRDVVAPELEALTKDFGAKLGEAVKTAEKALSVAQAAVEEVRLLRRQMAAAQALDVGFKETGKLILLTRIGDQDRVKILDMKPTMTAQEYKAVVERLKEDLGVGEPVWVDKPMGMDDVFVGVSPARRTPIKAVR